MRPSSEPSSGRRREKAGVRSSHRAESAKFFSLVSSITNWQQEADGDMSPRMLVTKTRTSLQNQKSRMNDPVYRQLELHPEFAISVVHSRCFDSPIMLVLVGNTNVTPRENARNIKFKKNKKTLDKHLLCFYDFLRGVFVARFSGERRTGARWLLGIWIVGLWMQVVGDSGGWLAPNHSVFSKSLGFFQMTRFFPNDWFFPKSCCRCL